MNRTSFTARFVSPGLFVFLGAAGCRSTPPAPVVAPVLPISLPRSKTAQPPAAAPRSTSCTEPGAHFHAGRYAPKPLTLEQGQIIADAEAFQRDHGSSIAPAVRGQLAEHAFARARSLYEANHWGEAAESFRALAMKYDDMELGVYAMQLYLDSVNVLASHAEPQRPICYQDMQRDVPLFLELYCGPGKVGPHGEACMLLRRVRRDLERTTADPIVQQADRSEGDKAALYERGGEKYFEIARSCCDEVVRFGGNPHDERCDELAYNAGKAFLAAGRLDRAKEALSILLDPRNKLQNAPLTRRLTSAIEEASASAAPKRH
jgi:hypothetical protein